MQAVQQQQHPALEVVRARLREGSAPGRRKDKFKVGLVVEGGGMRGVVTGAALQAMHDLGMRCGAAHLHIALANPCMCRSGWRAYTLARGELLKHVMFSDLCTVSQSNTSNSTYVSCMAC